MDAFYTGLVSGKIDTDEDALWQLYQTKEDNSTYRKLKSGLREILLESLCGLDIDSEDFTDFQKAYFDCHKKWAYVKILIGRNAPTAAISLATKLLKQTTRFDFVHLSMEIASYLRLQYALRESNDKKFQEVNRLFAFYRDVHNAECFAEESYALYMVTLAKTRNSLSTSMQHNLQASLDQLSPLLQKFDSYRLHLYGRLLELGRYKAVGDYSTTLVKCEDAIRFFLSKPYEARGALQIFYYEKLSCHIQLRQIEEGQQTATQIQRYLLPGTYNWFKAQELFVNLYMHTGEYQSASTSILKVIRHPRYQFLPENVKEVWRIYEAYLYFLSLANKVNLPIKHSFKVGKFLNETPILSKDKSGMNVAIKVIQILLFIAERKYGRLLEETESMEQYGYRYLSAKPAQRSFLFLKMLLQIPTGQFDLDEVEKRTRKYWNKLSQLPFQVNNPYDEVEIVPYEYLWPMAIQLLAR